MEESQWAGLHELAVQRRIMKGKRVSVHELLLEAVEALLAAGDAE